jgi:PAS domain S-box-containing protein
MAPRPGESEALSALTSVQSNPDRFDPHHSPDSDRDLIEHSRDLLSVHDLHGRLLSVNPVPARLLGYSVEEILQIPMRELVDPGFRDQFGRYLSEVERAGQASGIVALLTRSGERRFWEYHNTLRSHGLETPVVRGIAHDVTARVHAEKALRDANQQLLEKAREQESAVRDLKLFRSLLDQSYDAIEVIDLETKRLLDVNETEIAQLGYSREELLSMTIFDIDPQVTLEIVARNLEQIRKDGFVIIESLHRRKDGTTFPVEINVKHVKLDKDYVVAVSRDITERKIRTERLQEYEKVVENLDEMIVVVNRDHRYVLANRAFLDYRRMTKEQLIGRHASEILHSGSYETIVKGKLNDSFKGKIVHYEMKYEYPHIGARELSITYLPIEGPNGIDRVAAVLTDITERKQAAQLLEESEKRFRAVHQRAPVGIALVDSNSGRFLQVNPKLCEITGRSAEEMLQLGFQDITHPDDMVESREQLQQLIEEKTRLYDVDKRYLQPDGTIVRVKLSVVPMWASGEEARWHMAIVEDITERKRTEEAIATLVQVRADSSEGFFPAMASELAKCLEADYALIGELVPGDDTQNTVRTLGVCAHGRIADNFTYGLPHTPCENVATRGTCSYVSGVADLFPQDLLLRQMNVEGYVGTPLRDSKGNVVGIMSALYSRSLSNPKFAEMLLELFSTSIAANIERKRAEATLRRSETELREAQRVGHVGSWYRDLKTDRLSWSDQLYRLLGVDPKQGALPFNETEKYFSPESRERLLQANEQLLRTGTPDELEVEFRREDGTAGWATMHREVDHDDAGGVVGIRGTAIDITERKAGGGGAAAKRRTVPRGTEPFSNYGLQHGPGHALYVDLQLQTSSAGK